MKRRIAIPIAAAAALTAMITAIAATTGRTSAAQPAAAPFDATRTPATPSYVVGLKSDASGRTWTGHESVRFTNVSATALKEVYLRLWDGFYGSCPTTPITVSKVTGGTPGVPEADCTALKITLPEPLARGKTGSVAFDLKIAVPDSGADRFGHDGAYDFLGNALPVLAVRDGSHWHLDPYSILGESFYSLAADFKVTLDHPSTLKVPATGTSTDTRGSSGRTITTATATKVRDFAWAAGPFSEISATTSRGVKVNVYRRSGISAGSARSMRSTATAAVDAYARRFGAYPYGEVDVVLDDDFSFGGMEYPGFVLSKADSTVVAHELAHQWWYGIVGDDEFNAPWLDEAFADYATDLYRGIGGSGCWSRVSWTSSAEKISNSMGYWDQGEHSSRYGKVVYEYGKCALHDLRRVLGDAAMTNLLRGYARSHWYGVSTTAEFKAAAQAMTSTDLTSFWAKHRIAG